MTEKKLVIKILNGQWFATQDGKRLTAQQTAALIAKGIPYTFGEVGPVHASPTTQSLTG